MSHDQADPPRPDLSPAGVRRRCHPALRALVCLVPPFLPGPGLRKVDPIVAPSIDPLHESQSDCSEYGPRPVARAELGENVGDIVLDRPFGQVEAARDLLVRISSRQEPQDFELTSTEVDLSDFCLRGGCQPRVNRLEVATGDNHCSPRHARSMAVVRSSGDAPLSRNP